MVGSEGVSVFVEPPFDVDGAVSHVPSNADPFGAVAVAAPPVDGGEGYAEVVREIGWAEQIGSPRAGIDSRVGGRRGPVMGVGS